MIKAIKDPPPSQPRATSRAAAASIAPHRPVQLGLIFSHVAECGDAGSTADEALERFEPTICQSSMGARFVDLARVGAISRTGEQRRTRRGRWADVFSANSGELIPAANGSGRVRMIWVGQ